jgi:transposase
MRVEPWRLKKRLHRRRNEIERLFRRLKGFRRIFSRFDKLDLCLTCWEIFGPVDS